MSETKLMLTLLSLVGGVLVALTLSVRAATWLGAGLFGGLAVVLLAATVVVLARN